MNQNIPTIPKDSICNICGCEEPHYLHHVWYPSEYQRLCTSCVLFLCKEYYCPNCFEVISLIAEGPLITCDICGSKSHPDCFKSNPSDSKSPPKCASCLEPQRLIFFRKELRSDEDFEKKCRVINFDASKLLLTASAIGDMLMYRAWEEQQDLVVALIAEWVIEHPKAKLGVIRAMREEDLINRDRFVESLLDYSNMEDDNSSESLRDDERMQRSAVEGQVIEGGSGRVPMDIDLNEECHE